MKKCPVCKSVSRETDLFCRECGSMLDLPEKGIVWVGSKGPSMLDGPGSSMICSDLSGGAEKIVRYRFNCPHCSSCTYITLPADLSNLPMKYTCTCGKELEILLSPVLRVNGSYSILPEEME